MWAIKERIFGFLVIIIFMVILFSPARGYCVILKGNLLTGGSSSFTNVLVYLYDWDIVKLQGFNGPPIVGVKTGESAFGGNFGVDLKSAVSVDKTYVLVFSTIRQQTAFEYPSFVYGAYTASDYSKPSAYKKQPKWWDLENIPKIRFPSISGTFDLLTFTPPTSGNDEGIYIFGYVRDKNGVLMPNVGVELYADQNNVPVKIPYPFFRYVITAQNPDSLGRNFKMGGVLKNTPYYIKLIANKQGYLDTFIKGTDGKPKQFIFTDNKVIDSYKLTAQGATISGLIKDKNGNTITSSKISIQAISDSEDEPYGLFYVHNPPNTDIKPLDPDLSDAEKYLSGYDRYNFNSNGSYEIKGLPFEGHKYFLVATELSGKNPKKYATPLCYDANNVVFNLSDAKKISLSGAATVFTANFNLRDGACIEGEIILNEEMSEAAKTALNLTDPNVFSKEKLNLVIEAIPVEDNKIATTIIIEPISIIGEGPYKFCGLPPISYYIRSYDPYGIYPLKYYKDQYNITGELIHLNFGETASDRDINLDLGGLVTGRVVGSNNQSLSKVPVSIFRNNLGNPLVGYYLTTSEGAYFAPPNQVQTDENGRFYARGLFEGLYTVFVYGDPNNGYLPQFYNISESNPSMIANQASTVYFNVNDPNFLRLNEIKLIKSGESSGGIISGSISLDSGVASLVKLLPGSFSLRLFNSDTGIEVANCVPWIDDPVAGKLPYSIMVQANGDYIISVQDNEAKLLPHYYRSGGATVNLNEATSLKIPQGAPLEDKDIVLSRRTGTRSGKVLDPTGKGVSGLYVYANREIKEGPEMISWIRIRSAETDSDGEFDLKGLYKGTYIFSVVDPNNIYTPMYYTTNGQGSFTPEDASKWVYDPTVSGATDIIFNLKKGGRISGTVNSKFIGTLVNAYRIRYGEPFFQSFGIADSTSSYEITGLSPGEYVLTFQDPNSDYLPVYYTQSGFTTDYDQIDPLVGITVGINMTTGVPEMDFSQSSQYAAQVEGQIRKDTGTGSEPMKDAFVFLYSLSGQKEFWATAPAQYTITDVDGSYSLMYLLTGDYRIIAFDPLNRPISTSLTIKTSDLGSVKQGVDLTIPSDWINAKYSQQLKLEKGLNLIAYPTRIPTYSTGYSARSFIYDIRLMANIRGAMGLKAFSNYDHKWQSFLLGSPLAEGMSVLGNYGSDFKLSNGQGFMLYSQEDGPTINFRHFPGQTGLWLKKGINLVGNVAFDKNLADISDPNLASDPNFTTRKMLSKMSEKASASIQTLDAMAGRWKATFWLWGKPAGADTKIKNEQGYLVSMKEDRNNWYPTNSN